MKRCSRCKNMKPVFLFSRNHKTSDKLACWCKKCDAKVARIRKDIEKDWFYPYKGLNDPKRITDMHKTFAIHAKRDRKEIGLKW